MKTKELITLLLEYNQNAEIGFLFYDTAVFDIEISTSTKDDPNFLQEEILLFSQRFAKIEK